VITVIVGALVQLLMMYVSMLAAYIRDVHRYCMGRWPGRTLLVEGGILLVLFLIGSCNR